MAVLRRNRTFKRALSIAAGCMHQRAGGGCCVMTVITPKPLSTSKAAAAITARQKIILTTEENFTTAESPYLFICSALNSCKGPQGNSLQTTSKPFTPCLKLLDL
jgi:hypothetical protein